MKKELNWEEEEEPIAARLREEDEVIVLTDSEDSSDDDAEVAPPRCSVTSTMPVPVKRCLSDSECESGAKSGYERTVTTTAKRNVRGGDATPGCSVRLLPVKRCRSDSEYESGAKSGYERTVIMTTKRNVRDESGDSDGAGKHEDIPALLRRKIAEGRGSGNGDSDSGEPEYTPAPLRRNIAEGRGSENGDSDSGEPEYSPAPLRRNIAEGRGSENGDSDSGEPEYTPTPLRRKIAEGRGSENGDSDSGEPEYTPTPLRRKIAEGRGAGNGRPPVGASPHVRREEGWPHSATSSSAPLLKRSKYEEEEEEDEEGEVGEEVENIPTVPVKPQQLAKRPKPCDETEESEVEEENESESNAQRSVSQNDVGVGGRSLKLATATTTPIHRCPEAGCERLSVDPLSPHFTLLPRSRDTPSVRRPANVKQLSASRKLLCDTPPPPPGESLTASCDAALGASHSMPTLPACDHLPLSAAAVDWSEPSVGMSEVWEPAVPQLSCRGCCPMQSEGCGVSNGCVSCGGSEISSATGTACTGSCCRGATPTTPLYALSPHACCAALPSSCLSPSPSVQCGSGALSGCDGGHSHTPPLACGMTFLPWHHHQAAMVPLVVLSPCFTRCLVGASSCHTPPTTTTLCPHHTHPPISSEKAVRKTTG